MDPVEIGLWAIAAGLVALTGAGFLSRHWWAFDMASHLRTQLALGGGLVALLAFIVGEPGVAGVALIAGLVNTLLVLPQLPGRQRPLAAKQSELRVLFANVLEKNHEFERLARVIDEADADIVVLVEVDADAIAQVRIRLPQYPYFEQQTIGSRPLGIGLLSKIRPERSQLVSLGESGSPLVIARYADEPFPLTVIGAHPMPPYRAVWFRQRTAYMRKLADIVVEERGEVIVVGDFNITPWAWHFHDFLERCGLRDSRIGFGLQTTWPSFLPPLLRIPIDHCFVSSGLAVTSRCVLGRTGSDHLPVVVDVSRRGGGA